jgi:hypothetical protein
MMKLTLMAIAAMSFLAANVVIAADCATEIAEVEAAMSSATDLTSEELERVAELLEMAKTDCASDTADGASPGFALLEDAKVILGISDAS